MLPGVRGVGGVRWGDSTKLFDSTNHTNSPTHCLIASLPSTPPAPPPGRRSRTKLPDIRNPPTHPPPHPTLRPPQITYQAKLPDIRGTLFGVMAKGEH